MITPTRVLCITCIIASGGLASLWLDEDGQLRNTRWTAPVPVKVDTSQLAIFGRKDANASDPGAFLATLERPLFAPDRRPPPPPPTQAVQPVSDSLTDARLMGIMSGATGGVVLRAEGRVRRVALSQTIGDWTLKSVGDREATFERNQEIRVIRMEYASLRQQSTEVGKVPNIANIAAAQAETYKRQLDEQDERERRVAAMRAKMKP